MPQDFGIFFGDEFLGTSTPKQGIKHIINPKRFSGNVDFKDQVIVNQSLNSCTSELKCSYTKPEAKKPRAIGDSASNLNTSWFLPIDHVVSADWPQWFIANWPCVQATLCHICFLQQHSISEIFFLICKKYPVIMANFRMHFDINNYSLKKILEKYSYATY